MSPPAPRWLCVGPGSDAGRNESDPETASERPFDHKAAGATYLEANDRFESGRESSEVILEP